MDDTSTAVVLNSLIEWLTSEGGFVHEGLSVSPDEYGGHCLRIARGKSMDADKTLIIVPRSLMIEVDRPGSLASRLATRRDLLAIRLLEERDKGSSSFWSQYLSHLPTLSQLAFLPIVDHFQQVGSEGFLSGKAQSIVTKLSSALPSLSQSFEDQILGIIKGFDSLPPGHYELKDWLWATCIVSSRALNLWNGPTLVPIFDFLNHRFPPNVRCQCKDDMPSKSIYSPPSTPDSSLDSGDEIEREVSRSLNVDSVVELGDGVELLWSYSSHTNDADWLLSYGFVPEESRPQPMDNSNDEIERVLEWARNLPRQKSTCGILGLINRARGDSAAIDA